MATNNLCSKQPVDSSPKTQQKNCIKIQSMENLTQTTPRTLSLLISAKIEWLTPPPPPPLRVTLIQSQYHEIFLRRQHLLLKSVSECLVEGGAAGGWSLPSYQPNTWKWKIHSRGLF